MNEHSFNHPASQHSIVRPGCGRYRRGQILPIAAGAVVLMGALAGLAIDAGMMFLSRGHLTQAVDAGALVATRYISRDETEIRAMVEGTVLANDPQAQNIEIEFDRATRAPAVIVTVRAQENHDTTFIRILGVDQFKTIDIRAEAQAIRFPLLVGIIVDRSGSMANNGGESVVREIMPGFLSNFSETMDRVGIYSYNVVGSRELSFTQNFITPGSTLFTDTGSGMYFKGGTGPTDALRLCLEDIQNQVGYNDIGVRKIIVFLTDGRFNTFSSRPPNTLGAFNEPPAGMSASDWSNRWFTNGSTTNWGADSGGASYGGGSNISLNLTNSGNYLRFAKLNVHLYNDGNASYWFPALNRTNSYRFQTNGLPWTNNFSSWSPKFTNTTFTNTYETNNTPYRDSNGALAYSDTLVRRVNPSFRWGYTPSTTSIKFLSAVDGTARSFTSTTANEEVNNHMLRYSKVGRKTVADASRTTFFTIGFTSSVEPNILKQMANVSGSSPPYTPIDANQPYDDSFGYTYAGDAAALERTLTALGLYLATRLMQ